MLVDVLVICCLTRVINGKIVEDEAIYNQARSRGRGRGARAPPEVFRLELNSVTKVEFFY